MLAVPRPRRAAHGGRPLARAVPPGLRAPLAGLGLPLAALYLAGCPGIDDLVPIIAPTQVCAPAREESVACTLDGDTFQVAECGGESVRLLGVSAPEIAHAPEPAECWGDEAADWASQRLDGRTVRLEFDAECTDIYGRTLAWVWIEGDELDPIYDELVELGGLGLREDGGFDVLFNEFIIRAGQADVYDEAFEDVRYFERMEAAAAEAEAEGLGLWSACGG